MKLRFLKNPKSGQPDLFITLSLFAVLAAIARFLGEGMTIVLHGHTIVSNMHTDASAYAAFLAPVLGAHGYMETRNPTKENKDENL